MFAYLLPLLFIHLLAGKEVNGSSLEENISHKVSSGENNVSITQENMLVQDHNVTLRNNSYPISDCVYKRPHEPKNSPVIMIPLYHWKPVVVDEHTGLCKDEYYLNVAKGCHAVLAIINPGTGPLKSKGRGAENLKICMEHLGTRGVKTIGYVSTKLTSRNPVTGDWTPTDKRKFSDVREEIDIWMRQYQNVTNFLGVFLGDVTNYTDSKKSPEDILWYQKLADHVRTYYVHSTVVFNSGVFVDTSLHRHPRDISIVMENRAKFWRPPGDNCSSIQWTTETGSWGPGPWCPYVPKLDEVENYKNLVSEGRIQSGAFLHSANLEIAMREVSVAQRSGLRYFYVTDLTLEKDPWEFTPSFWIDYLRYLDSRG